MDDGFFKPPSLGMWLLVIAAGLLLAGKFFPVDLSDFAAWTVVGGGVLGVWAIARWLGRWIGFAVSEARIGFAEGVNDARERRRNRDTKA